MQYPYFVSKPHVEDDLVALGNVYYSMTTNDMGKPKPGTIIVSRLFCKLPDDQRLTALVLVKSLLKLNNGFQPSSIKQLLRNPLFTQNVENARSLLTDNQIGDVEELQNWYEIIGDNKFDQNDFEDLKNIVGEFNYLFCTYFLIISFIFFILKTIE